MKTKIMLLALLALTVQAFALGVSPADFTLENVKRGETYEYEFVLSTSSYEPQEILVQVHNGKPDWINMESTDDTVYVSKGNPQKVKFRITPHLDTNVSKYTLRVTFASVPKAMEEGMTGAGMSEAVMTSLFINVIKDRKEISLVGWIIIGAMAVIFLAMFIIAMVYLKGNKQERRTARIERGRPLRELLGK